MGHLKRQNKDRWGCYSWISIALLITGENGTDKREKQNNIYRDNLSVSELVPVLSYSLDYRLRGEKFAHAHCIRVVHLPPMGCGRVSGWP